MDKVILIIELLEKEYPDAKLELNYENPFQLLVAAILAAQCTDKKVNEVSKYLFNKYKGPADFALADLQQLEKDIKPTGFYKSKARNIIQTSKIIIERFNSKVPAEKDLLLQLHGVADKTANMIMCNAFNIPSGVVVDTHVKRLAYRIGLTKNRDPKKIEEDLKKIIPKEKWIRFPHLIAYHGRRICLSRKPKCNICVINKLCDYEEKNIQLNT